VAKKRPTRSEEESYRLWFFVISQLLMLSMIWLLYQEFFSNLYLGGRRPWKDIQLGWFEVEKERAERNFAAEERWLAEGSAEIDGEEVKLSDRRDLLRKEIDDLEGGIIRTAKRVEFERLKTELQRAELEVKDQEVVVAFAKADEDEMYYWYRNAKHHGHPFEEEKARYEAAHEVVVAGQQKYDLFTAKRDALLDQVGLIKKELDAKKKALEDLEAELTKAQRALDATRDRWTGIEQFWNQEIELVDRCHTCHMAYDKCGFTSPKEILWGILEQNLAAQDLTTRFCLTREEIAKYMEVAEKVRDSWYEEEKLDYDDVKDELLTIGASQPKEGEKPPVTEPVLAVAARLDIPAAKAEPVYRTHPYYWDLIRQHPSQDYGCTTCHYGEGRGTKGVGLNYLAAAVWRGRDPEDFLSPFTHATSDHYWEEQILDDSKHHTEASCFNCHMKDYELPFAPNFSRARKLVQNLGCTGCHPLGVLDADRKHGPTLATVLDKANADWVLAWIQNPRALRPRTKMPNFWPSAVKKTGEVDPDRADCNAFDYARGNPPTPAVYMSCLEQREQESAYMLAYLEAKRKPLSVEPMPSWASAERGREIFEKVGCRGCHNMGEWTRASVMPGSADRDLAPNLTGVGDKLNPGWIFQWVENPKAYWPETRMPSLRLDDQEAWHIAAYLSSAKTSSPPVTSSKARKYMEEEGAAEKGQKLIAYYGCFGCHEIPGFENAARIGADLTLFGSKLVAKLDYGDVKHLIEDPHAQTWVAWTDLKVREPRAYSYEKATTRMPQFDVSDREAADLILFLKSQNEIAEHYPEHVKKQHDPDEAAIQRGGYLVDVYNCGGCHLIDDRGVDLDGDRRLDGGDIYPLFADTEDKFRAPPKLIREGAKVYPDWLFGFLKAPFKLRENYEIRMPTFQFTDQQAADLVAYFSAKAKVPYPYVDRRHDDLSDADAALADTLFREAQCLSCHNLGGGTTDPKNVAPNLLLTYERLRYDWLFDWFMSPQMQAPGVGMPNFFSIDEETGELGTPLTELAGGDAKRQIELIRAYVIELGRKAKAAKGERASAEPEEKGKKRRRG
jgi:cytochrome c2